MGFRAKRGAFALCAATAIAAAPAEADQASAHRQSNVELIGPSEHQSVQFASPYAEEDPVELTIRNFSQALNQAAQVDRQQVEGACKGGVPTAATTEQRYAWAATCRYSRH
jgi:hypothetical protein